jgi:hypothetical protein
MTSILLAFNNLMLMILQQRQLEVKQDPTNAQMPQIPS